MYSGALGFLAVNGTADLSVVIRTLVASPDGLTIGAGGAIVAASEPRAELEEMLLKARPLLEAVGAPSRPTVASPSRPARRTADARGRTAPGTHSPVLRRGAAHRWLRFG